MKFKATNTKTKEEFVFGFEDLTGYKGKVNAVFFPGDWLVENGELNSNLIIEQYTE